MQLYLDTADRAAAVPLLVTGAFRGITTNPVILQRAGLGSADIPAVHAWAVEHGAELVFLQTWGTSADELAARGRQLRALSDHVVVKLPATLDGTTACARLAAEGVPTLLTAAHTVAHAVLAGAVGAQWVAPYVSKVDDDEGAAVDVVVAMHRALSSGTGTGSGCAVLAASLRSLAAVGALAAAGVPAATLGTALAEELLTHPQTLDADRRFLEAAR
ncbi:transaldolase [Quadrisphaera granulorum]|uniref:Transaldolase n=1 Tax=Quadrisphaera granulorum TaxID=317664 RepID=A0A316AZK3_9ACTN|nr:transaldolase family protein [Quadrisphaera granulorum]PWJ55677.1 transaldolase [Quadrisphaera granulorum]SZE95174.1 transaldolase [Quadrisphaera granulorum]